jgi:hypothetical protein
MSPDGRDRRSEAPQAVTVEITLVSHGSSDDGGGLWRRRVVLAIGALAAVVAVWLSDGSSRHRDPITARGPDGVAAAYGYPLGCLSVTILATDRTYARADLTHTHGCGGITGYAPAIFHYVAGRWRLVPDAIGYMCFRGAVPPAVERGFALCVEPFGRGCARLGTPAQGRPAAPLGRPCAKLPEIAGVV